MIPRAESAAWIWPLILLALVVRLWGLQGQSFTTDELFEIRQAASPAEVIVVSPDGFPPLYSLALRGWLGLFPSDQHARLLSVLLGCLAVPVMWGLSPHLGALRSPLWPTLLLAVSPVHIWYSQEARAYSLCFLLAMLAIWTCLQALGRDRPRDWVSFVVVSLLGVFTHYWFGLLVACLAAIVLVERRSWKSVRRPAAAFSAVGLLALPILPLLQRDLGYQLANYSTPSPFHFWELGRTYYSFIAGYTLGPSIRQVEAMSHAEALGSFAPWIVLLGACAGLLGLAAWRELSGTRYLTRLTLLIVPPILVCGGVGNALGIGYRRPYVLWVVAPLLVALGVGVAALERPGLRRVVVAGLAGLCLLSSYQRVHADEHRNHDTRAVSRYLIADPETCRPVFVLPHAGVAPIEYYLRGSRSVIPLPRTTTAEQPVAAAHAMLTGSTPADCGFWLVYGDPVEADPGGALLDSLMESKAVEIEAVFAGLELYLGDAERLAAAEPRPLVAALPGVGAPSAGGGR